jgi:hypothetical protein
MEPALKNLIAQKLDSDQKRLEYIVGQIKWSVNHYGIVNTDGILRNLRDCVEIVNESKIIK